MRKTPSKQAPFDSLAASAVAFLESKGWKVFVIGDPRIDKSPGDFDYEFVLRFTGMKKDPEQPSKAKTRKGRRIA